MSRVLRDIIERNHFMLLDYFINNHIDKVETCHLILKCAVAYGPIEYVKYLVKRYKVRICDLRLRDETYCILFRHDIVMLKYLIEQGYGIEDICSSGIYHVKKEVRSGNCSYKDIVNYLQSLGI
jgi:hypothetical protein